jgi:hypothetical protein
LELVRKICTLLVFFLVPWIFLAISLEDYKDYNLHQVLSLLFAEKATAKVARRIKRVYILLDFTLLGFLSQGSKRDYNP